MLTLFQEAVRSSASAAPALLATGSTGYGRPSIGPVEMLLGVGITAAIFGVIGLVYWLTHRGGDGDRPGE